MKRKLLLITMAVIFTMSIACVSSFAAVSPFTGKTYEDSELLEGLEVHNGIDVSEHQKDIDWKKAKEAGVEFAIIRVGYSRLYYPELTMNDDAYYLDNIKEARENGIKVGVYYFSQALNEEEAVLEAEKTLELIKNLKIDLPVFYDVETSSGYRNESVFGTTVEKRDNLAKICNAYCNVIKKNGYAAGVYASRNDLVDRINTGMISDEGNDLWMAQWLISLKKSTYPGMYNVWQYTDSGTVDGIEGPVDCDFYYGDTIPTKAGGKEKVTGLERKTRSASSYTIKWNGQKNVNGYYVYRSTSYGGTYKQIAKTSNTYYKDSGLTAGREYYYKVAAYDSTGVAEKSSKHAAMVKPLYDRYGKTTAKKTIRTHAGTNYSSVKSVSKGKKLTILGYTYDKDGNTWYRVKYTVSGKTYRGYVKKGSMTITKKGTTTDSLVLRKNASTSSSKLGTISSGKRITIKAIKTVNGTRWYKTTYEFKSGKKTGWIKGSYVKAINLNL